MAGTVIAASSASLASWALSNFASLEVEGLAAGEAGSQGGRLQGKGESIAGRGRNCTALVAS